jgi:Ni/Fe-hydrogenase subunit HybB-like protein
MIGVLLVYFTIRMIDLGRRDAMHLMLDGSFESTMLYIEFALMLVIPLLLFNIRGFGQSRAGLFFTAFSVVLGFVTNRLNVTMTSLEGYYRDMFGVTYFPSVGELAVTISIVTAGFVLFALAVKYLPIFPDHEVETVLHIDGAPERSAAPELAGTPATELRRH